MRTLRSENSDLPFPRKLNFSAASAQPHHPTLGALFASTTSREPYWYLTTLLIFFFFGK
jgi:hypothetical protein